MEITGMFSQLSGAPPESGLDQQPRLDCRPHHREYAASVTILGRRSSAGQSHRRGDSSGWHPTGRRRDGRSPDVDSTLPALAWSLGAVVLGCALQVSNGLLDRDAMIGLTVTLLATVVAASGLRLRVPRRALLAVLGGGLAVAFALHLTTPAGVFVNRAGLDVRPHDVLIILAGGLAASALAETPWLGRATTPLLLALHFFVGVWIIRSSPDPAIDVAVWHREALHALANGASPYALSIPNIYGNPALYGAGLADSHRVYMGFPYPPLSLLMAAPGHYLFGDYRYMNLIATTATGGLMAYARPGRLATLAAALFLFTPRGLFVLEQGWTEPLAAFFLAATIFVACRAPHWLPYALGLLLAVKQYFVLVAPLGVLLLPPPLNRHVLRRVAVTAVATAAAITLPFLFWSPGPFIEALVMFQVKQPFRPDALSYMAWWARAGTPPISQWVPVPLTAAAIGFSVWRAPRTPSGFAGSLAFALLVFFAFAKQAFSNYYYLIIAALCCAVAVSTPSTRPTRSARRVA
jgi:hypothetical protein